MNPGLLLVVGAIVLFTAMIVCSRIGRRAGDRVRRERGEEGFRGIGAIDGAMYALFGLLIAFTFSGATGRLDARRAMIVQEANAIGTAWLRVDVASEEVQPAMRTAFREYVDSRIATWR